VSEEEQVDAGPEPRIDPDSPAVKAYFDAIEDTFVRLRKASILLAPADYHVARRWYLKGIPLALVQRVLEQVFIRYRERDAKKPLNTLRYCKRAIEAAWSEVQQLTAPGRRTEVEPLDVAPRLAAIADALPEEIPGREELASRVLGLAGESEAVEGALAELDRELLERAAAGLDDGARSELDTAVESTLATLAARLPPEDLASARERLRRQLLRRRLSLPVLSLFSPEAQGG
jgi:hypothetical protein